MKQVDYINTHATSTPAGDVVELAAIREVFGTRVPPVSSIKGLTGHPVAASGAHDAIYSLLMMEKGFIAPCANLRERDPETAGFPLVTRCEERPIRSFLSNSLGFGGTNASLLFRSSLSDWES
jgi:3-oxoacyl-[acyl-carrier-protein] synthase-1